MYEPKYREKPTEIFLKISVAHFKLSEES